MFFFVSEPVPDLTGEGASFAVGVITIHCSSMSEATSLAHRLRAALQARARLGVLRERKLGFTPILDEVSKWIDELIRQKMTGQCPASGTSSSPPRSRTDLERPE